MNAQTRTQIESLLNERRECIVAHWYQALAPTSFAPLDSAQVRQRLVELAAQFIELLLAEPFEAGPAEAMGQALADLRFIQPEAAGQTHEVLCQFMDGLSNEHAVLLQPRLSAVLSALMTGLFRATQATILNEQEQVRQALVSALSTAETALRRAAEELERRVQERTAELRRSEAQYRTLVESVQEGVYTLDTEARFTFVNDVLVQRAGRPAEWFLGQHCLDVILPAERSKSQTSMQAALRGEPVSLHEMTYPLADGSLMSVEVNVTPLRDDDERIIGLLAVSRDVTERKRAEETLRRERERAQSYLDMAGVMLVALDTQGRVTLINHKGCEILGYAESEILGRDWFASIQSHRIQNQWQASYAQIMAGVLKPPFDDETPVVTKSGEERLISWRDVLLHDEAGRIVGVLSAGEDITERKRAEVALRESEANFRALADNAHDGILVTAVDGHYVYANEHAAHMLGYRVSDLLQMSMHDLVPPAEADKAQSNFAQRLAGVPVPRQYETVALHQNGTLVPVELTAARTTWHGQPTIMVILRDISARKRAQAALEASETRYRTLVQSIRDGVYTLDTAGRFIFVNDEIVNRAGQTREWFLGHDYRAVIRPEDHATTDAYFAMAMRGEKPPIYELAYPTATGDLLWVELNTAPVWQDGRVVGLHGVSRDITQRKKAEEALRESEEKFRALAEQSPNMIFINQMGRVVFANQMCQDVMGYTRDEFYAEDFDFLTLVAPEHRELVLINLARHRDNQELAPYDEYTLVTRDGTRLEVIITTTLMHYEGAQAILGIVTDITARKAAEAAIRLRSLELAEEKQKLETILHSIVDGVCATDRDRHITILNPAAARLLGRPEQDVVGRPCSEILQCHVAQGHNLCETDCPLQYTPEHQHYKYSRLGKLFLRPASGRSLPVLSLTGPLTDPDNQVLGSVLTFRDATYEIEMERLQSEFTAMISHEIRTPLTNLKAAAQTITRYQAHQDEKTRALLARIIENQCNQLNYLVQRIQQMAQLESGHLDLPNEPLLIAPLVSTAVQGFQVREHARRIEIDAGNKDDLWVLGHHDAINMILNNLLENAAKYSRAEGAITVKIQPWRIDQVMVAVIDEGPPIPLPLRARVFERYYRVDNSDTRSVYGLGLGLPISLELVTTLGGQLWVDGEETNGHGNRFCFTLLRTPAPA
ncbi:MAG: PAS domain S-box protein [Chloroflexi bacterium]|nr:PAS domain S-box protein [Chloroflexota bacterium]MBU1748062.1 PAS domain S-box protein [Chloroflexota bacterium]